MRTLRSLSFFLLFAGVVSGCSKTDPAAGNVALTEEKYSGPTTSAVAATYTKYLIRTGQHNCDQSMLKSVSVSSTGMNFMLKLNESAIYKTIYDYNQCDINKVWGFSEGLNHQYNSARIGWAYCNGAVRLYGYTYSKGVRYSAEISPVALNTELTCSIKFSGYNYQITVNGVTVVLPRGVNSTKASGYQLYPYFGGDEVAPHDVTMDIKPIG